MNDKTIQELRELIKHPKSPLPEYGTIDELARHYVGGQKSVYDMFFDKITDILSRAEQEAKEEPLDKISTPDLIAELERRRPCKKCARNGNQNCYNCRWNGVLVLMREDNFKEAE